MIKKPLVFIVILNWNGFRDSIACLESLKLLDYNNFRIIVVDNHSQDESVIEISQWLEDQKISFHMIQENEKITSQDNHLILIQAFENGGFAKGNNIGAKLALDLDAEYIWFLNNDTVVKSYSLCPMVNEFSLDTQVGMVGSVLLYMDNSSTVQVAGGVHFPIAKAQGLQLQHGIQLNDLNKSAHDLPSLTYVAGASMLVSSAFIKQVGLMTEDYFLYFEEIDWATRGQGWKLKTAFESHVYHKEGVLLALPAVKNAQNYLYSI